MHARARAHIRYRVGRLKPAAFTAGALSMALVAGLFGALPASAATAPRDATSTTASPSAPNASGSPAPAPTSATGAGPSNLLAIPPAYGITPAQQAAMTTATAQAKATGKAVTVTALTDEVSLVTAQPNGHFTLEANVTPVRTRHNGKWVPIDTSLRANADGSLSPAATAYGTVRFSSGGTVPLAQTSFGGVSYTLSWPGRLPAPHVSGPTATYPDVLPGVDLQLEATQTGGFSTVLIVKTAAAAHDPRLKKLTLPTRISGGQLTPGPAKNGISLSAGPHGPVLRSASPMMWDSNTDPAATSPKTTHLRLSRDPSNAGHAGAAARLAPVTGQATTSALTLIPDAPLLSGPHTVYPVYIDPTIDWTPTTGGTPDYVDREQGSPCTGTSFWDNAPQLGNTSEHELGIGRNLWNNCLGLMDPYFQWKLPTAIHGAIIQYATVKITRNYSAACGSSASATLHWSGGINSGTSWANPKPADLGHTITHSWPTQTGLNCTGGDIAEGFDLTSAVASNTNAPQITVELEADGDPQGTNGVYWFGGIQPNPTLQISYNVPAATPTNLAAITGGDNVGCATTAPYPYLGKTLATNTPVLQAQLHDPDGGHVQATFQYWIDGSSTTSTGLSADNLANGATATYSLPSTFVSSLTNGQTVDWKVQDSDGGPQSPWSPTCHFTAEPTGPNAPTIAPNSDYPDTDTGGGVGAHAGTASTFTFNGATDGAPATSFVYALDQKPATTNPPASQIAKPEGTTASSPANWWKLTDGAGTAATNTATPANTATLSNSTMWTADTTRSEALGFNGTTQYLTLPQNLISSQTALSVHLWFKTTGNGILFSTGHSTIGTTNPNTGAMPVLYVGSNGKLYGQYWTGAVNPIITPGTVNDGTWHQADLIGNNSTQTMYLDGVAVGSINGTPSNLDPLDFAGAGYVNANGWAGLTANSWNYFNGEISDIQTYTRALTSTEVGAMYNTNNAAVTITPPSDGPHTLWVYARDAAGDSNIGWASYPFTAAGHNPYQCPSFSGCLNNTAITPDNNPSAGGADGYNSFSATDLTNAGWKSGQTATIDGATFALPTFGTGQPDNILAAGQNIPVSGTGNALSLLVTATNANATVSATDPNYNAAPYAPPGTAIADNWCFLGTDAQAPCPATYGTVNYTSNSSNYDLTVPDWTTGPASIAAVTLPHRNCPAGQQTTPTKIYMFTIPLNPGETITSITLPDLASSASSAAPQLHVFGIALRNITTATTEVNTSVTPNTTTTATLPASTNWTGAWANPTEGQYNFQGSNFSNQTFRIALKPSVSGSTVRIKLDNALGTSPLTIGHATIALDTTSGGMPTAIPSGTFTQLTFGGQASTTVPAGAMAYADPPASFPVTANQWLLVSFALTNSVPYLVQHSWANTAYEYLTAAGSGDKTTDVSGTPFTGTGTYQGWFTDVLTDVDVATTGDATQAVLGDGLIDAWQPNTSPIGSTSIRLSDDLAAAEPTTPLPYGTIAEGIESNQIMTDNPETYSGGAVGGPSALSRIDRDILDNPEISTVLIYEGLDDVLNAASESNLFTKGYTALNNELNAFGITPVYVLMTPCDGYPGDGATTNDPCTAAVDQTRLAVNKDLTDYPYYIDAPGNLGIPDTGNGETKLDPNAQVNDHVNLSIAGYAALANAYLIPQDTWPLTDGANGATFLSSAQDTAAQGTAAHDPYLGTMNNPGQNPVNLSGTNATNYTWNTDAARVSATDPDGTVLSLDGAAGYAATSGPVINTAASFTVSTWVKLSSTTHNAIVAAQDGTNESGFYLGYGTGNGGEWKLYFMTADTTNPTWQPQAAATGATTTWTHLVGVYNAATKTAQLYVNGTLAATATGITTWNATGATTLGRDLYNGNPADYFPGEISNTQDWDYALSAPQITALYDQIQ